MKEYFEHLREYNYWSDDQTVDAGLWFVWRPFHLLVFSLCVVGTGVFLHARAGTDNISLILSPAG